MPRICFLTRIYLYFKHLTKAIIYAYVQVNLVGWLIGRLADPLACSSIACSGASFSTSIGLPCFAVGWNTYFSRFVLEYENVKQNYPKFDSVILNKLFEKRVWLWGSVAPRGLKHQQPNDAFKQQKINIINCETNLIFRFKKFAQVQMLRLADC